MATPTSPPHHSTLPISPNPKTLPLHTPITPTTIISIPPYHPNLSSTSSLHTPKPTQTHSSTSSLHTLASALQQCLAALSLREGAQIHARILRLGLSANPYLSNQLLHLYSSCGHLIAARFVFNSIPLHLLTPFSYNCLIRAYTASSLYEPALDLFLDMLNSGSCPNEYTLPFVLKSCSLLGLLNVGHQIHAMLVKTGLFIANVFCASALLDLYAKWACLGDACNMFDRIPHRNTVTWNTMVSAHAQNGHWEQSLEILGLMEKSGFEIGVSSWNAIVAGCIRCDNVESALELLGEMLRLDSVKPNSVTFNTLLPVIPTIPSLHRLRELHGFATRHLGIVDMDPTDEDRLWSATASGYAFHGCVANASQLFERIKLKNCQLWTSMVSGFINCGQTHKAFSVFREMAIQSGRELQILPKISLTLLLSECDQTSKAGLEIHAYANRNGLESNTSVCNALMAMYARRGDVELSEQVFERTPEKDVVSWNTMVSSHALIHDFDNAFNLFQRMLAEGIRPDEFSFSSVLNGCGHSSYLRPGMALHGHITKSGFSQSHSTVQNALMDTYAKCGCAEEARKLFDDMQLRDNISWNTIISCYGLSARPYEAFSLFNKMKEQGWKPNRVTFIALLSSCSHAGLIDEALHFFESMSKEHGIVPDMAHYACIIDNLGRAGQLDRAYQFIRSMPVEPDDCVWGALLSGCRIHGNVELGEVAAKHLIELEPQHSGYWVLLSNIYADASRWEDVMNVRAAMKDGGVKKCPGYSWIEVGGSELHRFLTADKSHKQCGDIYFSLNGLTKHLKDEGYIPIIDSKFFNSDEGSQGREMWRRKRL